MTVFGLICYDFYMVLAAYLNEVVTMLAKGIGVRSYRDMERLEKAASYISDQFSSFGIPVEYQSFGYRGNTYKNIIAELKGRDVSGVLVVGAHYDTVSTTPGADDNASGIAGLLGLASLLAGKRPARTIRLVAFSLEEWPVYRTGNMASYHYAKFLREKNETIEGMICLEMIGFFRDKKGSQRYPLPFMEYKYPDAGNFIAMVGNIKSKGFTERIAQNFRRGTDLPVITLNAPAIVIGIDFSDHWSFNKLGYKALMVTDTAFYRNPHYHAPTDLPETLDYNRMAMVVEGIRAAVEGE